MININDSLLKLLHSGVVLLKDWYTRKEVAQRLGVSKATVYNYAKQGKIHKIEDPHRLYREARYRRKEVDLLAEERKRNQPTGIRPSELAKELNVPVQRIYSLLRETDLPVDQLPAGEERMIYSIPNKTAEILRDKIKKAVPTRGTRAEFYHSQYDIALYQLFITKNGQKIRMMRNEEQEWGFFLPSGTWIPYVDGQNIFKYEPAYSIHQPNVSVKGYTDFSLPKNDEAIFLWIDFVYEVWGIENIRMRDLDEKIELSIKSGKRKIPISLPKILTEEKIRKFIVLGDIIFKEDEWTLISGYRRTTFDLPINMLEQLRQVAEKNQLSMSEYVEQAIKERFERESI